MVIWIVLSDIFLESNGTWGIAHMRRLLFSPGYGCVQENIIDNGYKNHGTGLRHIFPTWSVVNMSPGRSTAVYIYVVISTSKKWVEKPLHLNVACT